MKLFKTIEELQAVVPVAPNFELGRLGATEGRVIRNYLRPLIGNLADAVITKFGNDQALDASEQALLDEVRKPVAHLALHHFLPLHRVNIESDGVFVHSTENRKLPTDRKNDKLDKYFLETGLDMLDDLLEWLEEHAATYSWKDKDEYKALASLLVSDAKTLTTYVDMAKNSRRVYMAMAAIIRRVQEKKLPGMYPDYEALITKLKDGTALSDAEKRVVKLAKPAIAFEAWAKAIDELQMQVTPDGLLVLHNTVSRDVAGVQPATMEQMRPIRMHYQDLAAEAWAELEEYLQPEPDVEEIIRMGIDHDEDSKIFFL